MTPWELAKSGTEHGEQRALFAWANMAEEFGFAAAWDDGCYKGPNAISLRNAYGDKVPELKWFHAIPNGGSRGDDAKSRAMQGAKLKAEGVKKGIADTFLPLPMWGPVENCSVKCIIYAGLYIELKRLASQDAEMKRAKGTTRSEQDEFICDMRFAGFACAVCFGWEAAARDVQSYIEHARKGK